MALTYENKEKYFYKNKSFYVIEESMKFLYF